MPDTPRLASADPGIQPGYAPISWMAIASFAVADLFAVIFLYVGYTAYDRKLPLIEPILLALPALAVVLAFVARRQIRASEGTRTGETYANYGWWIGLVGGLCYVAYLVAIDFDIRNSAEKEFVTWTTNLGDLDPNNPLDPALFAACHLTVPPGERAALKPKDDPAGMALVRAGEVAWFRQVDVVRLCGRNRGAVEVRIKGLQTWELKPAEITCTMGATLITPEGEFSLVVPMRAVVDDKKNRRWQILPSQDGYVKTAHLTRYGWMVQSVEAHGRAFASDFLGLTSQPGGPPVAYAAFVHPGSSPSETLGHRDWMDRYLAQRMVLGGPAAAIMFPQPPGAAEFIRGKLFTLPGGAPAPADKLQKVVALWNAGRLLPGGTILKNALDNNPVLYFDQDRPVLRLPAEFLWSGDGSGPGATAARAPHVVLRLQEGVNPPFLAELAAARGEGGPKTDRPPSDLPNPYLPWRVSRIESDMTPTMNAPSPREGMQGMGGMPGM